MMFVQIKCFLIYKIIFSNFLLCSNVVGHGSLVARGHVIQGCHGDAPLAPTQIIQPEQKVHFQRGEVGDSLSPQHKLV